MARRSDVLRILPGHKHNVQPMTGCETAGVACEPQGTNVVYLDAE